MKVERKDAKITPTGADEDFPGTFEVILSAPTKDRDGETLLPDEWKMPLPDRITFDSDHGMSVATTVGSGVPTLNSAGELVVSGTFSSLSRAQETRTLVKEGHITTTSVAFMTERTPQKDGRGTVTRELLNGAFVAIPSNREALVLASKDIKAGARNSTQDAKHMQAAHDSIVAAGATCTPPVKSWASRAEVAAQSARLDRLVKEGVMTPSEFKAAFKSVDGSLEATQDRARDALNDAYGTDAYVWLRATLPTSLVFGISTNDSSESETYQQDYTDDGSVVTLTGERKAVDLAEVVKPDPDESSDPPAAVDQAAATAAAKAAVEAAAKSAAADEADALDVQNRAMQALASAYAPE